MTQDGLNTLKDIERKLCKFQEKVENMSMRIYDFYTMEEDVLDRDAHMRLSNAGAAMKDAVPCITDAILNLREAYNAEEELMDTYGIINDKTYE